MNKEEVTRILKEALDQYYEWKVGYATFNKSSGRYDSVEKIVHERDELNRYLEDCLS